jgi:hypothetical protein
MLFARFFWFLELYRNDQCCGFGSARIRNFCRIRNSRVPDQDPGPYPKMDRNINKNHQKKAQFHYFDHFYILNLSIGIL